MSDMAPHRIAAGVGASLPNNFTLPINDIISTINTA